MDWMLMRLDSEHEKGAIEEILDEFPLFALIDAPNLARLVQHADGRPIPRQFVWVSRLGSLNLCRPDSAPQTVNLAPSHLLSLQNLEISRFHSSPRPLYLRWDPPVQGGDRLRF